MPFKTILFILFLLNFVFSQGTGCTQYTGNNGLGVDLSSLQGVVFHANKIFDNTPNYAYDYDFVACGTMPDSKMANCKPYAQKPIISMCQEWVSTDHDPGAASLGVFSSAMIQENTLVISYKDGDDVGGVPRSATLTITCDPKMNTINMTSMNNVAGTLTYVGNATSKIACPVCLKCNGHGKCTSSACICDVGYSGTFCNVTSPTSPPTDPFVIALIFNFVEGFVIVALVVLLIYTRRKSYTSMN